MGNVSTPSRENKNQTTFKNGTYVQDQTVYEKDEVNYTSTQRKKKYDYQTVKVTK